MRLQGIDNDLLPCLEDDPECPGLLDGVVGVVAGAHAAHGGGGGRGGDGPGVGVDAEVEGAAEGEEEEGEAEENDGLKGS